MASQIPHPAPHPDRRWALRLATAALAPLGLAALLAPPVPWPLTGRLFGFVDQIGHAWHYWDLAEAVRTGGPLLSSTRVHFPIGADHLLHRGGHLLVALSWPLLALGLDPAGAGQPPDPALPGGDGAGRRPAGRAVLPHPGGHAGGGFGPGAVPPLVPAVAPGTD